MDSVSISVIMPVYNAENHIKKSVRSVLDQSYTDFELIIVDDGSTDSSGKIIDNYAASDNRIKVIHKPNAGVSRARNTGIEAAQGKYILFLDADDEMDPNLMEDNMKLINKLDPDVLIFNFRYVFPDNIVNNKYKQEELFFGNNKKFFEERLEPVVENELMNAPWNKIIRSELIKQNNVWFDERFSIFEDAMFSVLVCNFAKTICVNSDIYHSYYIWETGSLRTKWTDSRFLAIKELYNLEIKYCRKFKDNYKQLQLFNRIFGNSIYAYMQLISVTSNFSFKKRRGLLKEVCNDKVVRQVFLNKNYYQTRGVNKRIIRLFVKVKASAMIILLYKMKNYIRS